MLNRFLFCKSESLNSGLSHIALLFLRVFAGLTMAFAHGVGKIPPQAQFVSFLESMSLPLPIVMAWLAGLSEFLGGILVALGLLTRPAALTLVVTMSVAAFVAHASDPFVKKEMALLYFMIFIFIFSAGPGKWSLDNKVNFKG